MTLGPDHNIWFTIYNDNGSAIGSITPSGTISRDPLPNLYTHPQGITSTPDGNIWFTGLGVNSQPNVIGVVTKTDIPTQLGISVQPPAKVTAGKGFGLEIQVENAEGQLDRNYNGMVTINLASGPAGASLVGSLTVAVNYGQAVFYRLSLADAGNGYTITATATGLTPVTSDPFQVTDSATHLVVTAEPPETVSAGVPFSLTVSAEDDSGQIDTSFNGPITLAIQTNPGLSTFTSVTLGAIDGQATFDDLTLNRPGDDYTLIASTTAMGVAGGPTDGFDVEPGPVYSLQVATDFPSNPDVAGSPGTVTVTALDADGNVVGSGQNQYLDTVDLTSMDPLTTGLPPTYQFTLGDAGKHTFDDVVLATAGPESITAVNSTDNQLHGSATVTVVAAGASMLAFGKKPTDTIAGIAISPAVTVHVEDPFGNTVTSDTSTVTLTLAGGTFAGGSRTAMATASGGVATFAGLVIDAAGSYTLSASDGALASPPPSDTFTISPAGAHQLAFSQQPTDAIAGADISPAVTVDVQDQFGNTVTSDTSTVTLTLAGGTFAGGSRTAMATASGGVATFARPGDRRGRHLYPLRLRR